jgi:hypothetical protein
MQQRPFRSGSARLGPRKMACRTAVEGLIIAVQGHRRALEAFVHEAYGINADMKHVWIGMLASAAISTVAEAADGCGRGMFYNGRRCVPQEGPGYGPAPYQRGYGEPRYERGYGPPVERGPQLRLNLGGRRDEGRYSPPNPAFKTFNNCPPNFTVQDGLCKPYTGR